MQRSSIEWTATRLADGTMEPGFTSNPLKYRDDAGHVVWACVHMSEGCRNCYSEALARRYRRGEPFQKQHMDHLTPFLDEKELHHMLTYKPASGKMCFVCDMTDLFGEWVPDELIDRVFAVFALRPDVTWQVLTKRAKRMREYLSYPQSGPHRGQIVSAACGEIDPGGKLRDPKNGATFLWPLPNLRLGVSVENQQTTDERIPELLRTPAACRFVSYEPALEAVDFLYPKTLFPKGPQRCCNGRDCGCRGQVVDPPLIHGIDQIIIGGESGPRARPFRVEWARDTIRQCREAGTACFVKQLGARPMAMQCGGCGALTDKRHGTAEYECGPSEVQPLKLRDKKGGDMLEWPKSLRVRMQPGEKRA